MGKFDGIYFASDLDGSLLDSETNEISKESKKAIKHFMEEGGLFGFATGRIPSEVDGLCADIGANSLSVTTNGGMIYDIGSGEITILKEIEEDIIPFFSYVEKEFPNIMFEIISDDNVICYSNPNESLKKHQSITNAVFKEVEHFTSVPRPWTKVALWAMPCEVKSFADTADRSRLSDNYNFMHSFEYCCEITQKDADKGSGIAEIRKRLAKGVKICVMGDNENDVTMLNGADISFAPSNAVASAKGAADIVLKRSCRESAVCEAFDTLLQMREKNLI